MNGYRGKKIARTFSTYHPPIRGNYAETQSQALFKVLVFAGGALFLLVLFLQIRP